MRIVDVVVLSFVVLSILAYLFRWLRHMSIYFHVTILVSDITFSFECAHYFFKEVYLVWLFNDRFDFFENMGDF